MRAILLFIVVLAVLCKRLQKQSSKVQCEVNINGVDLSSKVNGKIVAYKGSNNDNTQNVTLSRVVVADENGQKKQETISTPRGEDGKFSEQARCFENYESEYDIANTASEGFYENPNEDPDLRE